MSGALNYKIEEARRSDCLTKQDAGVMGKAQLSRHWDHVWEASRALDYTKPLAAGCVGARDKGEMIMSEQAMKAVLRKIFIMKRKYNELPLFQFMRDERIDAAKRLSFFPCMAHFILSFGDLNKFVLRSEPANDRHQEKVNAHTYEDDHHWPWYLEDFQKLGFDLPTKPTDLMRFLWGEETEKNRILMYRLTAMIAQANGAERIAIIEAIEETGNVLFTTMLDIAKTLEERYDIELRYCGTHHHALESGHAVAADHKEIAAIELDDASMKRCMKWAEEVFLVFEDWTNELLAYARRPAVAQPERKPTYSIEMVS